MWFQVHLPQGSNPIDMRFTCGGCQKIHTMLLDGNELDPNAPVPLWPSWTKLEEDWDGDTA